MLQQIRAALQGPWWPPTLSAAVMAARERDHAEFSRR